MSKIRESYNWEDVRFPITDDQVREWIKALRSGEYDQGQWTLKVVAFDDTCAYCCLGVAQEQFPQLTEDNSSFSYLKVGGTFTLLPQELQSTLADMNDLDNKSFNEIADFLEEGFFGQ